MMASSGSSNISVIVAWNPSNDSQFAASSSSSSPDSTYDKLHLFSRTTSGPDHRWNSKDALRFADNELHIQEIRTWSTPQISCLDWSPALCNSKDSSFIAYGNHIGDVHIINGRYDDVRWLLRYHLSLDLIQSIAPTVDVDPYSRQTLYRPSVEQA